MNQETQRMAKFAISVTVIALGTGLLAACSSTTETAYQLGYREGCFNGEVDAGKPVPWISPDSHRYATDPEYARGFNEGEKQCYQKPALSWGGGR